MSKPLRVAEAADYIGVSKGYIYRLVELKKIPHYRLKKENGPIYFRVEELENYIFRQKIAADYEMNERAEEILEAGR
jgi:excisionase family DNA binding protein